MGGTKTNDNDASSQVPSFKPWKPFTWGPGSENNTTENEKTSIIKDEIEKTPTNESGVKLDVENTTVPPQKTEIAKEPPIEKPIENITIQIPKEDTKITIEKIKEELKPEVKEEWTKEEESSLNDLIKKIEDTKRRITEIDLKLSKTSKIDDTEIKKISETIEGDKKDNPFKHFLLKNMDKNTFKILFLKEKEQTSLEDINKVLGQTGKDLLFSYLPHVLSGRGNTVIFSSNGFSLQLQNGEQVRDKNGISIKNPKAKFLLVYPDWTIKEDGEDLNYEKGETLIKERSTEYQKEMLETFSKIGEK